MDTKYLEIIKAPLVTEKSSDAKQNNKYTFLVSEKATKTEIKEAVEKIFKVKVESISTLNPKNFENLKVQMGLAVAVLRLKHQA